MFESTATTISAVVPFPAIKTRKELYRHRADDELATDLPALIDSIIREGLTDALQVIDNKEGTYTLVCGHRRHAAISAIIKSNDAPNWKADANA